MRNLNPWQYQKTNIINDEIRTMVEKYARLREYELTIALQEAKADVDAGRYTTESVADHVLRVADV